MITSVTHGRPGTAMIAWQDRLSSEQIATVVDYIRAEFMRPPVHPTPAAGAGQSLYKQHCAVCHGDKGAGAQWTQYSLNPAPRDFTAPESRAELTRERMLTSATYGRPGTAMMPFSSRLSAADIALVVDYIRSSFMGLSDGADGAVPLKIAGPAALTVDMTLPFPDGLSGDAARGGEFYMKNCITCHGHDGDGRGPRAAFNTPPPVILLARRRGAP
jgi:mono/diheme cytochrome c family protein